MTIDIYSDGRKVRTLKAQRVDVTKRVLLINGITGKDGLPLYEAFYTGEIHFQLINEMLHIDFTDPVVGKFIEIKCYDWNN